MADMSHKYLAKKLAAIRKQHPLIKYGDEFYPSEGMQFVFSQNVQDILSGGSLISKWIKGDLNFVEGVEEEFDQEFPALQSELDGRIFVLTPVEFLSDCAELTGQLSAEAAAELADACLDKGCDPEGFRHIPELDSMFKSNPAFKNMAAGIVVETTIATAPDDDDALLLYVFQAKSNGRLYFFHP